MSVVQRLARPAILALPPSISPARRLPGTVRLDANENPYAPLVQGIGRGSIATPTRSPRRCGGDWPTFTASPGSAVGDARQRRRDRPADPRLLRGGQGQRRDRRTDLFGLCAVRAGPGRGRRLRQAWRRLRVRCRRCACHAARRRAETAVPLHAEQPDRHAKSPRRTCGALPRRLPDTIVVADEAYGEFSDQPSLAGEAGPICQPRRAAHLVQGLWAGRRADRLRDRIARNDRPDRPRVAALSLARPQHRRRARRARSRAHAGPSPADRHAAAGTRSVSPTVLREVAEIASVRQGGNFLFLEVADPADLARRLAAAAVRVRFRPAAAPGGVRVTVGTPAENAALAGRVRDRQRKRRGAGSTSFATPRKPGSR